MQRPSKLVSMNVRRRSLARALCRKDSHSAIVAREMGASEVAPYYAEGRAIWRSPARRREEAVAYGMSKRPEQAAGSAHAVQLVTRWCLHHNLPTPEPVLRVQAKWTQEVRSFWFGPIGARRRGFAPTKGNQGGEGEDKAP